MRKSELEYFVDILESRKVQIQKNIAGVQKELRELHSLELNDEGDYASISTENLRDMAIGEQQELELLEIQVALGKIKDKLFGICEMCEEPVSMQRLKVKPHARYCIDCREIVEKQHPHK